MIYSKLIVSSVLENLHTTLPTLQDLENDFWRVFHQRISLFSERIAIKSTTTALTFSELNQLANHIAAEINTRQIKAGKGVGLLLTDGAQLSASFIGILKSQNYIVPLDASFPISRLKSMLEDSETEIIITDGNYLHQALDLAKYPETVINIEDISVQQTLPDPILQAPAEQMTQIVYTSGTTGEPKGVVINYRYYWRAICHHIRTKQTIPGEHLGNLTSYSFGSPYTHTLTCLMVGATFYPYSPKRDGLAGLASWLKKEKISYFTITPALFRKFVNTLKPNEIFPDVRLFALGAEKKLLQDVRAFQRHFSPHCKMILKYVATETYIVSFHIYDHDYEFKEEVLPAGYPLKELELFIWDSDHKEVPRGEVGEIVVRGSGFAQGYWHQPELTRQKFLPDPIDPQKMIVRTGDLGKILPDGQLQHIGRLDDLVKIKGIRIELASIENYMLQYPGIVQAAARAFEDDDHNQKLAAYYVPLKGVNIAKSDLRKFLADRLPLQMLPNYLVALSTIPLTGTNKIDRKALPIPDLHRPMLDNDYISPKDDLENRLVKIWEDNIGIHGIGVTDNYFELGGDSLSAVLLFVQIEQVFKRRLPVSILLTHPSIRQLVKVFHHVNIDEAWSPIISLRQEGVGAPVFFIPGKGGYPIRFHYLTKKLHAPNPLYAMQAWGVDKGRKPYYSIEETAQHFIAEIRKIYPHGPYHLCGESGGGTIALEIAQQLRSTGEQVPVLVMFDSFGPQQTGMVQFPKTTLARLAYYYMLLRKHSQIIIESTWQGRQAYFQFYRQQFNRKLATIKQNRQLELMKGKPSAIPAYLHLIEQANIEAYRKYLPQAYPGRVILFRAKRNPASIDATNGWDKVELGELVVHNLDCFHGNILFEPAVDEVVEKLDGYLSGY